MFGKEPNQLPSPYLTDPNRLGDVIAAIQVMATYKFYKLDFAGWADRITADKLQAGKWERIFLEHPEFFRLDSAKARASLVWRRQFPKRFDVDTQDVLSQAQYKQKIDANPSASTRISRVPLSAQDIKTLIDTAVNLHARALEQRKDGRWWLALAGAVGGLVGSIIGAAASHH